MRIPRFWSKQRSDFEVKGLTVAREIWGWSLTSLEDAAARARESLARIAQHLQAGTFNEDGYSYISNPPREEIVREFGDPADPLAIITRNSYGCLVLNTRDLMFVDVDSPEEPATVGGFFSSLFGSKSTPTKGEETLLAIGLWVGENPEYRVRIYRTAAGFRVLIVNVAVEATSPQAQDVLQGLNSDPLYQQLSRVQECFRARLTPKPWRMHRGTNPPNRYPWQDEESEREYRQWEENYQQASSSYRTCEFLEEAGANESPISDAHQSLIQLHDELTGALGNQPLA